MLNILTSYLNNICHHKIYTFYFIEIAVVGLFFRL